MKIKTNWDKGSYTAFNTFLNIGWVFMNSIRWKAKKKLWTNKPKREKAINARAYRTSESKISWKYY